MTNADDEIGRVCPYARQQCTLAAGCVTHDGNVFGADVLGLEFRALGCEMRGSMLFYVELQTGRLRSGDDIVKLRGKERLRRMHRLDNELRARRDRNGRNATGDAAAAALAPQEG